MIGKNSPAEEQLQNVEEQLKNSSLPERDKSILKRNKIYTICRILQYFTE